MSGAQQLRDMAAARGVAVSYLDWQGRPVDVSAETLAAVLDALGDDGPTGTGRPARPAETAPDQRPHPAAVFPERRGWGFTVQLYALRSRRSWGHGDFADLAELATWSARDHGADFVLVNPLHAAEPTVPVSPSPYLPMSRRYLSPLYLRIEDIPEYEQLNPALRAEIDALGAPLREVSAASELIERDAVWDSKAAALELIGEVPQTAERRASFEAYRAAEGQPLTDWATWCAIAELHGPDWRRWPPGLRDPRSAEVAGLCRTLTARVRYYCWLQWLAAQQAEAAQAAARRAGMRIGIVADLAVGSHPGGADAWAFRGLLVAGVSVGAPPDEFNQRGQDWSLPPWHPERLAAADGAPLAELTGAALQRAGGLRIDHVMGLSRLWWVPEGMSPDQGTYVRYDHELIGDVVAAGAAKAGAVAIGEDLGTVEPWLREFLAGRHILGTSMLWFERDANGRPLRPALWRRGCLATVGTHDMPPAASFLNGEYLRRRQELGLLTRSWDEEWNAGIQDMGNLLRALTYAGVLPFGPALPPAPEFITALYAFLARTPAVLIGVSLAEAIGQRVPQNVPGTTDQYPNWRIPLTDGEGEPVLLEDLPARADLRSVIAAVSR